MVKTVNYGGKRKKELWVKGWADLSVAMGMGGSV